jgi:UDP-3-O-[3-hydroxymyristoyl] glucosamine N-acyltransferase
MTTIARPTSASVANIPRESIPKEILRTEIPIVKTTHELAQLPMERKEAMMDGMKFTRYKHGGAFCAATANVEGLFIGPKVVVLGGAEIGSFAVVYVDYAVIGERVKIAEGATVGASSVGSDTTIGMNVEIRTGTNIGSHVNIGDRTIIYPGVTIEDHVIVGPESIIGTKTVILEGSTMGPKRVIGDESVVAKRHGP